MPGHISHLNTLYSLGISLIKSKQSRAIPIFLPRKKPTPIQQGFKSSSSSTSTAQGQDPSRETHPAAAVTPCHRLRSGPAGAAAQRSHQAPGTLCLTVLPTHPVPPEVKISPCEILPHVLDIHRSHPEPGISFSGDIQHPPGHGPVQPALGDPALAGGWAGL